MSDCRPCDTTAPSCVTSDAVAAMLRQRVLRAACDFSDIQDHLDCAELAIAAGFPDHARRLRHLAGFRLGFNDASLREPGGPEPSEHPPASGKTINGAAEAGIAAAIVELGMMIDVAGTPAMAPLPQHGHASTASAGPRSIRADQAVEWHADHGMVIDTLYETLHAPPAEAITRLTELLDRLDPDTLAGSKPDPVAHVSAELPHLMDIFIGASLRHFLRSIHDLARPPFGSPAIFYHAARLHPAGLGAWFGNASRTVRDTIDLFGLLQAAGGPVGPDEQDRWIVRFAAVVHGARLNAMIDDLADIGRMRPVWDIFTAALRNADGAAMNRELLLALRDAGLDNGDVRLAATTQRMMATLIADSRLEWRILGDIHASAGEAALAGEAYGESLRLAPGDREINLRLHALHAGSFTPFAVLGGYGERSRRRRRLQQAADTTSD